MTDAPIRRDPPGPRRADGSINRIPHMPGLDGLRAVAVVAVMVYHANSAWLHGGFLGVEVFFVISGYLITLLLIAERDRTGTVNLRQFWLRRFRRLLPAVFVMLTLLILYLTIFYPKARGRTRGDIIGGVAYISNWYQVWVGAGYTATEAFAPLRHLWSLAVEEQFYLLWPLVMAVILAKGTKHLPKVALWLIGIVMTITLAVAVLFVSGDVDSVCSPTTMHGYWTIFGRCISVNDFLYLGTFSRAGGLLMGAAFAMVWRPGAIMRSRASGIGKRLDVIAIVGMVLLAVLVWHTHLADASETSLTGSRFDPWLFRGGFLFTGIATLMIVAAVTHQGASAGRILGNPFFTWIGTRSYGLYLYHWPIYQIIRKEAGKHLSLAQFVLAMLITIPITEASYRFVETPIRQGQLSVWWRGLRARSSGFVLRRETLAAGVAVALMLSIAGYSMVSAPNRCVGAVECASEAGRDATANATTTSVADQPDATSAPSAAGETTTSGPSTSATPTTLPSVAYYALGESVMLGATGDLLAAGISPVDAAESRQANAAIAAANQFAATNRITNGVVIQLGTNGTVDEEQWAELLAPFQDLNLIVVLTVHADRSWIPGNNAIIKALPSTYPNVKVVDWDAEAANVPGGLAGDGIHLTTAEAKSFYTNLVRQGLGLA